MGPAEVEAAPAELEGAGARAILRPEALQTGV